MYIGDEEGEGERVKGEGSGKRRAWGGRMGMGNHHFVGQSYALDRGNQANIGNLEEMCI